MPLDHGVAQEGDSMTRPPLVVAGEPLVVWREPWSCWWAIVVVGCGPETLSWREADRATEPAAIPTTAATAARRRPGRWVCR